MSSSINVQVNRNNNIISVGINSTGPQGQSAYETWLALGNIGTKEEFLSLQFDEPSRVANENNRKNAETIRVQNENVRIADENAREDKEDIRIADENIRVDNETTRKTNETLRQNAEITRESNENTRKSNETARQSAETNRETKESTRQTNEINRTNAESLRVTAENSRVITETNRTNAEISRVNSETFRTNSESERVTAESNRVIAEQEREEADILRGQTVEAIEAHYAPRLTTAEEQINSLDDEVVVIKQQLEDGTAGIDDSIVSTEKVWSSSKVNSSLTDIATNVDGIINMGSTVYVGEENNPPTDPNIKLWFKIIKPELVMPVTDTFFHFDANSLISLAENEKVSLWEDLSGNGYNLTQPVLENRKPTFAPTGLNGLPAVKFTQSNYEWLCHDSFALDRTDGGTTFIVFKQNSAVSGSILDMCMEPASAFRHFSIYWSSSGQTRTYLNNVNAGSVIINGSESALFTSSFSLSEVKIWKNGTLGATNAYSGGAITEHNRLMIGGDATGQGIFFGGNISEIIYFSRTLTSQEIDDMNAYLLEKWGF